MKLRPEIKKQHKELFYQIMSLRKDVVGVVEKKDGSESMKIGVKLKVLKFISQLKKKRASKLQRRSNMGITLAQQAYSKLQHTEMAVNLDKLGTPKDCRKYQRINSSCKAAPEKWRKLERSISYFDQESKKVGPPPLFGR